MVNFYTIGITLKMSIVRPDGAFTVESLLKEIADLKEQQKSSTAMWVGLDAKNDRLALMVSSAQTEIADLKKRCSQYRHKIDLLMKVMNSHQIEEVIDELEAEDFTGAEYFAGR